MPDLDVHVETIDFGEVTVGDQALRTFAAANLGEARVAAEMTTSDEAFAVDDATKVRVDISRCAQPDLVAWAVQAQVAGTWATMANGDL